MKPNYLDVANFAFGVQASPVRYLSFPRAELVVIHKSVQNRHLGMKDETATLDVGRNTQVSVRRRHPGRDCRDPEAMDGNTNVGNKTCNAKLLGYERSHPCALVSGNPCRNDVLLKTCV